ncbi:2-succinyl-5-enolpyruvyl-6-hydroxy-3-cyclohexene-1-carboxylic-acid synthase [Canicola haemoglobinophilus]|uniref:2-succinyl-5-enolpyruvyl-6-hydroxy-3-cyclohexene-1-carboxylate synthase n=1 Tax=Canicola haemoglobinophilus TaxID=733 RepID=A0A1V4B000_9PAST|nr:2-succinyl-5-enolpyruvyl-6-hydroxy-3-cyclohexene-1-carboxylic-acid synthase [Canicola haemoglobinophilus]OOR99107.1 2-succinyl-5-enolpyruvyl-6-hydroxy-3-cyclohexene-1-carboxylic-acid synthase [Canicola haemoglobinophilus]STO58825.1 2-succinyl-5-enolpyruvyl-6-hydroxy-3-cyclohexene-1-carboxylate synthase [Canicola haemoglobinophilus]
MSVSVFNRCWSKVILETLIRQGVSHFCIAPGSRSTPLTLEAVRLQENGRAICHTHFDERGLGFFALGIAKASKKPVAVIVTSGTATANLYPAIIEARQTDVPLIILTADRPPELLECGANQAILQQNMFAQYPVASVNLPRPSQNYSAQWLISVLDQACFQQKQGGVVHINVPFAEPLYNASDDEIDLHPWLNNIQSWLKQNRNWIQHQEQHQEVITHKYWDQWRTKRGVIIVGRLPAEQAMGIAEWAENMGWTMITDIQSHVKPTLPYADIWLANQTVRQKLLQAEIVIQFGSGLIGKRINQFLAEFRGEYWIIENNQKAVDPYHHAHTRFNAKPHHWLRAHLPARQKPWLLEPLALAKFCTDFVKQKVGSSLNEVSLAHNIELLLPKSNSVLFLGNSLFVRLADALSQPSANYPIYTNRGASGIDGLLATAAGIAIGSEQTLVAMIGDTSTLYDLNSFALFKQLNQPAVIFVINNNGGAIFDMLPVDSAVKEKYYRMSHHLEFSHIAAMFDLKYARPYTWADLATVLKQAYSRRETTLIEIKVNPSDGSNIYKDLIEKIGHAVIGA